MTTTDTTIAAGPPELDEIHVGAAAPGGTRRGGMWRGRPGDPAWIRPSLIALIAGTAVLYLWNLAASGYANTYYAAAVKAGSTSWKAMFFGSLDSGNFITVDKPPASLWVMDVSARIFGFNDWSLLAPQALEGVLAVLVLYLAVRRWAGPQAGLLSGLALALTPVAALMFRFNNPDALLVLLMTVACYAIVRAVEAASPRWVFLAGVVVGFAFLTKMLQGLILLPALTLVYLVAADTSFGRRVRDVLIGGVGVVLGAGWWVAAVQLTPAGSRPYIGGSKHNSILELTFGYNGIGRLTGADNNGTPGGGGGAGGGGGFSSGNTGLGRLFGSEMGTQISWLLPAALILLVAGLGLTRRRPRTDLMRAGLLLWGGWLIVNGLVFSYASGIIHPYYTVALAPPIAALTGVGVTLLWRTRRLLFARIALAVSVAATAAWAVELLGRSSWHPELRWIVGGLGAVIAVLLLIPRARSRVRGRAAVLVAAAIAMAMAMATALTLLAAPAAYSLQTASVVHTGAIPAAGPASAGGFGGPGSRGRPGGAGGFGRTGARAGLPGPGGFIPGGTLPGGTGGTAPGGATQRGGFGGGAMGGTAVSAALTTALQKDAASYRWAAATVSANEAGSIELGTGTAVMSLGGFNGTDPAITLAAFKALVAAGKVHYFIGGGNGSFIGSTAADSSTAYQIQQWVTSTFTAQTVGSSTVYELSVAQ